jgi:hypothetical protein
MAFSFFTYPCTFYHLPLESKTHTDKSSSSRNHRHSLACGDHSRDRLEDGSRDLLFLSRRNLEDRITLRSLAKQAPFVLNFFDDTGDFLLRRMSSSLRRDDAKAMVMPQNDHCWSVRHRSLVLTSLCHLHITLDDGH